MVIKLLHFSISNVVLKTGLDVTLVIESYLYNLRVDSELIIYFKIVRKARIKWNRRIVSWRLRSSASNPIDFIDFVIFLTNFI